MIRPVLSSVMARQERSYIGLFGKFEGGEGGRERKNRVAVLRLEFTDDWLDNGILTRANNISIAIIFKTVSELFMNCSGYWSLLWQKRQRYFGGWSAGSGEIPSGAWHSLQNFSASFLSILMNFAWSSSLGRCLVVSSGAFQRNRKRPAQTPTKIRL
jgi:hypothetical protein